MYTDIFLFIIAFSVFSLYIPQQSPVFTPTETLLCSLLAAAFLYLYCRARFNRLSRNADGGNGSDFITHHNSVITTGKTAALMIFAVLILFFDLKQALPSFLWRSEFLMNACGIAVFTALLLTVWSASYSSYRDCHDPQAGLISYTLSHARLSCTLVLPWLFFSALLDILALASGSTEALLRDNPFLFGAVFAAVLVCVAVFFPWIIVRLWGCRELPDGSARRVIENVCRRAGIAYAGICQWNLFGGRLITAGVMGFVPRFRYLLISPALLSLLNQDELEAVIAHEIGHVRHRHMFFYLVFILGYALIAYVMYTVLYGVLLTSDLFLDSILKPDGTFGVMFHVVPIVAIILLLLVYFRLLFGYISRQFERQADTAAFALTGSAGGIVGSLEKIATDSGQSRRTPNWHHYSIAERAEFMHACERNPALIQRHGRRVRTLVVSYCVVMVVLAAGLTAQREALSDFESRTMLVFVEKLVERRPHDSMLRFQLAGMYYEKKLFIASEKEYRRLIAQRPDFYDAYNNLAWLYATCEDESLRNNHEALRLARIAASLAPLPYILDTLAESLYVNGFYRQAVSVAEDALAADPDERAYYKQQLQKFRQAYAAYRDRKLYDSGHMIAL